MLTEVIMAQIIRRSIPMIPGTKIIGTLHLRIVKADGVVKQLTAVSSAAP
jgi:hypothetical protein